MDRFKVISKNKINELPKTSGVYCFASSKLSPKRSTLNPIYIGKAVNIRDRVKNHFQQPSYRDDLFIDKVDQIGFFETNSEIEALILEANLIKKHQPRYNVVWRDDKNYFYVAFEKNKDKIPFVYVTHQPKPQTTNYKLQTKYVGPFVEGTALKKTLRFLRRVFPYYTSQKHPKGKCTWCHLDLCPGPQPDLKEYHQNIKKLILILKGKRSYVLNSLKKEMKTLSKKNKFEEAGKVRDRIYNLEQIMAHTHVINKGEEVVVNLSGDKNTATWQKLSVVLQALLQMRSPISKIECYDVSNIQGKNATGSMIVFTNGRPDKSQYKKFKIRMENEPNDVAMLKETITRRLNHPEWGYPDIILIDGGKAQLNIAIKSKNEKQETKNIKVISIAKGKQELFIEDKNSAIPLKKLPQEVYNLIVSLDDEAHRFAIAYHKKLRKRSLLD